jgi:signal transduction histidine kinase
LASDVLPEVESQAATILIVDDHRPNLLAARAVLEPLGYPIVTASTGAEALRLAAAQDFVMIVMDVHMADLDGFQTTAILRQREKTREVPVIFLTAVDATPQHTRRGYELGAVDFIEKPYDPDVLRAKVRALVRLYTLAQRIERQRSREIDRLKDLFLGAVGHDLRNPLGSILMAQELTLTRACGEPSHQSHALRSKRAAERMHGLIEDILDLTRGQFTDGLPVTLEPTDLGEVARATLAELQLIHPDRAVDLEVAGDVGGLWDGQRLARVFSNLTANAIQHSEGLIQVRVGGDDHRATVAVHNGGGAPIPDDAIPRLFDPFRRGDSGSEGLGLGLYIVREIVRAHGGTVDVRSTTAEGTTFTVTLPKDPRATVSTEPCAHRHAQ